MKKFTLVFCAIATSLISVAQVRQIADVKDFNSLKVNKPTNLKATPNGSRASYWLNYALQLDDPNGFSPGAAAPVLYPIFPDSTIIIGKDANQAPVYNWICKMGTILDPKNMPVQGISPSDAFTLDSLAISYAYTRKLASSVVDTLIVDIIKHDPALVYSGPSAGPTHTWQDIEFDFATQKPKASNVITSYTILLTENDSSGNSGNGGIALHELLLATTGIPQQAAGSRIGAVLTFKPAYTYSMADSLSDKNAFYLLSYEQNGDNTDPVWYGTLADGTSDLNASYILVSDVRYNASTTNWNGYFHPTWMFGTSLPAEHHIIQFRISTATGVEDFVNGVKFGQNMPNPFSSNTTINYELENSAAVALYVYDVTGKLVAEIKEGNKTAGKHSVKFNAENMSAGVYYYSMKVNENTTSAKKMVIVK